MNNTIFDHFNTVYKLRKDGWSHSDLEEMSPFEFGIYVHLYLNELKEAAKEGN